MSAGKWVVVGMFALGILASSGLWTYWQLHLIPFMPLQEAIVQEFPGSAPRVDGGQWKMHKGTVSRLRTVMKVNFNPLAQDPDTLSTVDHYLTRYRKLASEHVDTEKYEVLELQLYQLVKEQEVRQLVLRRRRETWEPVDEDGNVLPVTPPYPAGQPQP